MNKETQDQNQTLAKAVSDRLCSARTVLDVLSSSAAALADRLGTVLGPWLDEPTATPFDSLLRAYHGRLSESRDGLAEAAEHHLDVQSRAEELDRRGEEAASRLSETMAAMRETFRGVYGCDQLAHFGFSERTPRRPSGLLDGSRELHRRLADPELELPPSRVSDFHLDCPLLARKIDPPINDLSEVLGGIREQARELRESERRQNEALAEHNEVFQQTAGTLESWLRMAGHGDQADRVRPSRRRPGLIYGVKTAA